MVVFPTGCTCEACGVTKIPTSDRPEGLLRHAGRWLCEDCLDEALLRGAAVDLLGQWVDELKGLEQTQDECAPVKACG